MADMNEQLAKALEGVDGADALSPEMIDALNVAFIPEVEGTPEGTPATETTNGTTQSTTPVLMVPVTDATAATTTTVGVTEGDTTDDEDNDTEDDESDEIDIGKAVTEATADMQKQLDDTTESLRKETERREISEHIETVRKDYPGLAVDPDVFGAVLYRMGLNALTDDDRKIVTDAFGAASALGLESPAFTEYGSAQTDDGSGAATLDKIAKSDKDDGKTTQQRVADAMETPEGHDAYQRDLDERARRL